MNNDKSFWISETLSQLWNDYSFLKVEARTWIDHTLLYDEEARKEGLRRLQDIKDGSKLECVWIFRSSSSVRFHHFFLTDGVRHFGFGTPSMVTNVHAAARVCVSCDRRFGFPPGEPPVWSDSFDNNFFHYPDKVTMTKAIRQRMRQIMGMCNYSLCLRNSEHVVSYVLYGKWTSRQTARSGILRNRFGLRMSQCTLRMINTFPSVLHASSDLDSEKGPKAVYAFTKDHYTFDRFDYFLDYHEDTYNVLVVGPTGAGKSRLVNIFFNQEICRSDVSHESVSKDVCFVRGRGPVYDCAQKKFIERVVVVADTIGFCDTEWKPHEVISMIRRRVSSNLKNIDVVYVLFRADRLLDEFVDSVQKVLQWLGYYKGQNDLRFVFVCTYAELVDDEQKAEICGHAMEMFKLKQIVCNSDGFVSLIYAGFPPVKALNDYTTLKVMESWQQVQQSIKLPPNCPRLTVDRKGCVLM